MQDHDLRQTFQRLLDDEPAEQLHAGDLIFAGRSAKRAQRARRVAVGATAICVVAGGAPVLLALSQQGQHRDSVLASAPNDTVDDQGPPAPPHPAPTLQPDAAPERPDTTSNPATRVEGESGAPHATDTTPGAAPKRPVMQPAQPYTPEQVCGKGYRVIDSASLSDSVVYLLWHGEHRSNCVVTLRNSSQATSSMTAYLQPDAGKRTADAGAYRYYAGPVRAVAPGCVRWGGSSGADNFDSPREHCRS